MPVVPKYMHVYIKFPLVFAVILLLLLAPLNSNMSCIHICPQFLFFKYNELSILWTLKVWPTWALFRDFDSHCSWLSCKTSSDQRSLNHWEEGCQKSNWLIFYLLLHESDLEDPLSGICINVPKVYPGWSCSVFAASSFCCLRQAR